jgi:hypothetical protein
MKNTDSNSPFNGKQVRTAAAGPKKQQPGCEDIGEVVKLRYEEEREQHGKGGIHLVAVVRLENAAKVIAYAPPNVSVHPGDRITIRHREKMVPPISHIRYEVGSNVTTGQVEYRNLDLAEPDEEVQPKPTVFAQFEVVKEKNGECVLRPKPAAAWERDPLTEPVAVHYEDNSTLRELHRLNPDALVLADREFDSAISGIHTQRGMNAVCVYSEDRVVKTLQKNRGLSERNAFNLACEMFMQADAEGAPNAPIRNLDRSTCLTSQRAEEARAKAAAAPTNMKEALAARRARLTEQAAAKKRERSPKKKLLDTVVPEPDPKTPSGYLVLKLKSGHWVVAHAPESMRAAAMRVLSDKRHLNYLIKEVPFGKERIIGPDAIRFHVLGHDLPVAKAAARPQLELAL